jgi:hypothetical protein
LLVSDGTTNAATASTNLNFINNVLQVTGSIVTNGSITAQTLIVQDITSSREYITGSTIFGSLLSNTHQFTGSVSVTGSLSVNGSSVVLSNQTGSMSVLSASFAQTASYGRNPFDIGIAEFNTTSSITAAGTTVVSSINTGSFSSAFYNYTILSSSNARSGQIMSVWSGSAVRYTEVTTTDLGNTATASFAVAISGANVRLNFTAPGVWTVKSIANLL